MSATPVPANDVLVNYSPPDGVYDELLQPNGVPRGHCGAFVTAINRIGQQDFSQRWEQASRSVHENGIAYTSLEVSGKKPRPWELDPLPLLIAAAEWKSVTEALRQRARLLNLVLQDLYGPQRLLQTGLLPPELVFSHPGFARPYHGQQLADHCFLHFYAADLARQPNGRWRVLADRCEAPSGLGYALENRLVISRMLPDVFRQCHVERLAPFFIKLQETMRRLAPAHRENPRVVLLSQGSQGSNFFEDAYLARYLGYTLVEGGDLAVRNGQVALKTLAGLLPVDVIFRRQNGEACDPLELAVDSTQGAAGLMQAARSGRVTIANALGSGIVESPVFQVFMPQLCRQLLGEELRMASAESWWCGHDEGRQHVLQNLDQLNVLPAFRVRGKQQLQALAETPREQLIEMINRNPQDFVGQEQIERSGVPVWKSEPVAARLAVRAYAVASGDSYEVLPGALARTSASLDPLDQSIRQGEGSKDVWILSDRPVESISLLTEPGRDTELRRSGTELPSRVADDIFWLGRQLERVEATTRLIRATALRLSGETPASYVAELPVLLRCLAEVGQIEPGYALDELRAPLPDIELALPRTVFDRSQPGSLRVLLDELKRLGAILRDRLSIDCWRVIHRIDQDFQAPQIRMLNMSALLSMTNDLILDLAAFSGIVSESMTRTHAFRFLDLGRRIERATQFLSLVRNCLIPLPGEARPVLEAVLETADSLMTYRSRYLANLQLASVLDLLLTDETNPRSLVYQFARIAEHVEQLPREATQIGYSDEQRLAMALLHSIRMVDIRLIADVHRMGEHEHLERLVSGWQTRIPRLAEAVSHRYLVHTGPAHQLSAIHAK